MLKADIICASNQLVQNKIK